MPREIDREELEILAQRRRWWGDENIRRAIDFAFSIPDPAARQQSIGWLHGNLEMMAIAADGDDNPFLPYPDQEDIGEPQKGNIMTESLTHSEMKILFRYRSQREVFRCTRSLLDQPGKASP